MKTSQRGFVAPLLLLIIAALLIGGGVYVYENGKQTQSATSISDEVETTQTEVGLNYDVDHTVTGYYTTYVGEAWGEKATCDALVVTGGDQEFINHFSNLITSGNAVNHFDDKGNVVFNLDLKGLSQKDVSLIKSSTKSTVTLKINVPPPPGKDAWVCASFGVIKSVI